MSRTDQFRSQRGLTEQSAVQTCAMCSPHEQMRRVRSRMRPAGLRERRYRFVY